LCCIDSSERESRPVDMIIIIISFRLAGLYRQSKWVDHTAQQVLK
jgi:hypothetical protein